MLWASDFQQKLANGTRYAQGYFFRIAVETHASSAYLNTHRSGTRLKRFAFWLTNSECSAIMNATSATMNATSAYFQEHKRDDLEFGVYCVKAIVAGVCHMHNPAQGKPTRNLICIQYLILNNTST